MSTAYAGVHPQTLRQYALLADGERGALVGPRGDIGFLCAPRWHDDAVFCALLGGRGAYVVRPQGEQFVWGGSYEPGSLVWHSRWVAGPDVVECREAMAFPADPGRVCLMRQVRAVRGRVPLSIFLECRAGFGAESMRLHRRDTRVWEGRTGPLHLRWSGAPGNAERERGGAVTGRLSLDEGDQHDLVLEISADPLPDDLPRPELLWHLTEETWGRAVPDVGESLAPRDVAHSWAVLRGMTTASGAMVAAATTSLPERADEGRDVDNRYAWIRDQCFAGHAVAAHGGPPHVLRSAAEFVTARLLADGDRLRPAYTVAGGPVPAQRGSGLPGYPGAAAVTGNRAGGQWQLDAAGEALLLLATAAEHDRAGDGAREAARVAAAAVGSRWRGPGAGIWETDDRLWTHSRLICVAGLRQAARVLGGPREAAAWNSLADAVLAETARTALTPGGRWRRATDDDRVDAALLIPPLRGAVPAGDPRTAATLEAVRAELVQEGFVYRYRAGGEPLGAAEGAFTLCGFFLALAEHRQGEAARALGAFERTRSGTATSGLFSEEYDVEQRQLRGNIPQAFVHALLLETATRLAS